MDDTCPQCKGPGANKYLWCRPCIAKAARGAARYFLGLTGRQAKSNRFLSIYDDPDSRGMMIRVEANKWQAKFKKRLLRRPDGVK